MFDFERIEFTYANVGECIGLSLLSICGAGLVLILILAVFA